MTSTRDSLWLLSDGRSGSTWMAQVLNFHANFHVEHEPIHAALNPRLAGLPLMPLPGERMVASHILPLLEDIRQGAHRTNRFGPTPPGADGLMLRDIFGLMIAPQVLAACPWLHPVVIARHPVEVARSKLALKDWVWFQAIETFLANDILRDAVPAMAASITGSETPFQRHVLSWAVCHAYFFARVGRQNVPVIRYPPPRDRLMAQVSDILLPFTTDHDPARPDLAPAFDEAFERRSATDRPPLAEPGLLKRLTTPREITRNDLVWAEAVIDDFGLRWLVR